MNTTTLYMDTDLTVAREVALAIRAAGTAVRILKVETLIPGSAHYGPRKSVWFKVVLA